MKAAVFAPEEGFRVQEVPDPEPAEGEILVRVEACGVCGSDRQVAAGAQAPSGTSFPVIFGHEISGRVASDGANWPEEERVVAFPIMPCGKCRLCQSGQDNLCMSQEVIGYHRPGGYAELVAVPEDRLIPLPDGVPELSAGLLVDALATPFHALRSVACLEAGESVVVIGSGGLGLGALVCAQAIGAQPRALLSRREKVEEVSEMAENAGAERIWSMAGDHRKLVREVRRWSGGGADVVLDTVGTGDSVGLGMGLLRPGGRLCVVGMGEEAGGLPPVSHWVRKGIRVSGSYASRIEDARDLISWVGSGRIEASTLDSLVSEVLPLSEIKAAFAGSGRCGRAVIQPEA